MSIATLPASELLRRAKSQIPPFNQPVHLVNIERVWVAHTDGSPPLIESVEEVAYANDPDTKYVHLSVWTANMMIGVTLDPDQTVTVQHNS